MTGQAQGEHNVIVANFQDDSAAYQALSELKGLDDQRQIGLRAAAVVLRSADGNIVVKDEAGEERWEGMAIGGVVGLLIGILGGPFGILIGGATGLLAGSLFDVEDEDRTESVLGQFSQWTRVGHPTLLAEAYEPDPGRIDAVVSRLYGKVLRRPVEELEAEIAAAHKAQHEARRQARKVLLEEKRSKQKAEVDRSVDELKAKLHPHKEKKHSVAASTSG